MTAHQPDGAGDPARSRFAWLRLAVGAAILIPVVVWVVRDGAYLQKLEPALLLGSGAVSLLTGLLHPWTLRTIAAAYGRAVGYSDALQISALASLGNAAGGLPLGTALKFAVLRQRAGLTLAQIAAGLAAFTGAVAFWLLAFATLAAAGRGLSGAAVAVPAGLCGLALALLLWLRARLPARLAGLVGPLLAAGVLARGGAISLLLAASFVLNGCVVGRVLLPEASWAELVFVSAAGILLALVTFVQALAGTQELAMALMAYTAGLEPTGGAQIALTLRATGILASAALAASAWLSLRYQFRRSKP